MVVLSTVRDAVQPKAEPLLLTSWLVNHHCDDACQNKTQAIMVSQ